MQDQRDNQLVRCIGKGAVRLVGWLEFNIPFQHKYGYIIDEKLLLNHDVCVSV